MSALHAPRLVAWDHTYQSTLALAAHWGHDARVAGLDRDTLDTDREAIRAIRDEAHADGHPDAYRVSEAELRAAWLAGYGA